MRVLYPHINLAVLCELFGKTRQGWYQWLRREESAILYESVIVQLAIDTRGKINNPKLGTSKLLVLINDELSSQGVRVGRDKLYGILREKGLLIRHRKRRSVTTNSVHPYRRYPNLIKNKLIERAEQVWASDITYLRLAGGFAYLSLITDCYSRKIVGFCVHPTLSSEGPQKALLMALSHRYYPRRSLIHHSDQGVQYCSLDYVRLLKAHDVAISMSSKGSPQENAMAERINGILKGEYGLDKSFKTMVDVCKSVEQSISSYNYQRPHRALDMQTPDQVHQQEKAEDILQVTTKNRIKKKSVNLIQE